MKSWQKKLPPYEGDEPYLYFAFAEADEAKAVKILSMLLRRGCRVWYSFGAAGSSQELLRRQTRSGGAAMTVLYLSDAACADADTKSNVLVNQKFGRPILCLDPDGTDRRLTMGLREDVPHVPLYRFRGEEEIEDAVVHAEGFSQEILGEQTYTGPSPVLWFLFRNLTLFFLVLTVLLLAVGFVGVRWFHWFRAPDEVVFQDPAILAAVRDAAHGGTITRELADGVSVLRFDEAPESWEELSLLPSLERIELPQQAVLDGAELPPDGYVVELSGGKGT